MQTKQLDMQKKRLEVQKEQQELEGQRDVQRAAAAAIREGLCVPAGCSSVTPLQVVQLSVGTLAAAAGDAWCARARASTPTLAWALPERCTRSLDAGVRQGQLFRARPSGAAGTRCVLAPGYRLRDHTRACVLHWQAHARHATPRGTAAAAILVLSPTGVAATRIPAGRGHGRRSSGAAASLSWCADERGPACSSHGIRAGAADGVTPCGRSRSRGRPVANCEPLRGASHDNLRGQRFLLAVKPP